MSVIPYVAINVLLALNAFIMFSFRRNSLSPAMKIAYKSVIGFVIVLTLGMIVFGILE